jgi:hypothetical protein
VQHLLRLKVRLLQLHKDTMPLLLEHLLEIQPKARLQLLSEYKLDKQHKEQKLYQLVTLLEVQVNHLML